MRNTALALAVTLAVSSSFGSAHAATPAQHHTSTRQAGARAATLQEQLAQRDRQIAALQAAVADLQAKVSDLQHHDTAQTGINATQADVNTSTQQQVTSLQASARKTDKLEKLVDDTSVSGRMFIDLSDVSQQVNGTRTAASGYGLDIKRGYLTISHRFDDIWSATLTSDFNYVANDGQTQLFIKNLYVQGKFSDAFVFRAGEIPMTWTPYVEGFYGYRYVENTLTDRAKVANTADWGLSANGSLGGGRVDYAAALVNGAGFKNPTRSSGMDFEGRLAFSPAPGLGIAVGGYSGTLSKDTATTSAMHTATRGDVMIAWARGNNRLGAEYFTASNWNTVLNPLRDRASGWSAWGSIGFTPKLSAFARFDRTEPSKNLAPTLRDRYFNFGLQWDARKDFKLALAYKHDDLRDAVNEMISREFGIFGDIAF